MHDHFHTFVRNSFNQSRSFAVVMITRIECAITVLKLVFLVPGNEASNCHWRKLHFMLIVLMSTIFLMTILTTKN